MTRTSSEPSPLIDPGKNLVALLFLHRGDRRLIYGRRTTHYCAGQRNARAGSHRRAFRPLANARGAEHSDAHEQVHVRREASRCRNCLGRNEPAAGNDGQEETTKRSGFWCKMRPMYQRAEESECASYADGNESLFLRLVRIVICFLAFACRFESRATDRFDQSFRPYTFVVGDDRFARHDVHSHIA